MPARQPTGRRWCAAKRRSPRVYDFILEARFDQVDAELRRACGPAPPEACDVLAATALWWRILLDPDSRALDEEFSAAVDRAIASTEALDRARARRRRGLVLPRAAPTPRGCSGACCATRSSPPRATASASSRRWSARIELEPGLDDAYFGIGLYKYYADVAPAAAKVLRFLLLLPGGDREEGLEQMLRARNGGRLLQGEADYQLHLIYLWYERQTPRALELLRGLQEHYPGNPLFPSQIAEIQDAYQHDVTASLATWRTLLSLAREQRVNAPVLAEAQARLGIARQLEALHQTDHAIEQLQAVIAPQAAAPYSSLALAYLRLGEALRSARARAMRRSAAYRSAPQPRRPTIRTRCASTPPSACAARPNARHAEAYRLSLEGWRRLEQNDLAAAGDALERSLALNADDPVARYRFGRVLQARKDDAGALAQFELAIRDARACPAPILATRLPRSGAPARARRPPRPRRSRPTASRRRCSAPPQTRATPPRARSLASTK